MQKWNKIGSNMHLTGDFAESTIRKEIFQIIIMKKNLNRYKLSALYKKCAADELRILTDDDLRGALRRAVKNTFVPFQLEKKVLNSIEN